MTMPNEIIAEYVIGQGWLTDPTLGQAWPLYKGNLPDATGVPNDIVAVFNTPGVLNGKDMEGTEYQHYGLQFRFRSAKDYNGYNKAQDLVTALLAVHGVVVSMASGEVYAIQSFSQASDIVLIQVDEKTRTHHTVNLLCSYTRTT